jgi:DNA-binding NarL/FixJ family response regulator
VSPPTPREQEVLEHLAMGMSNRDIADRLCISEAAVKAHLRHIGDKFDVRSRTQILVLAYRYGLVDPQSPTP